MYRDSLGLKDLVNLEDWQKIQDSFSESLGITLRTIDLYANALTRVSNPSLLYDKISRKMPQFSALCSSCPVKRPKKTELSYKEDTTIRCPFGLTAYILPIKAISNRIVAYIITGPVIVQARKTKAEYSEDAKKAGIAVEELLDAIIDINVFTHNKIKSIKALFTSIFSYMALTGFHKKRLGEIAPEVVELDPLFSGYYEEKVLSILLNTCLIAFDADSGSVMIVDKNTDMLHIKAASKLDEGIANNTNVKVGEGIAGMAAATARPIILPNDQNKNGLSKMMKRGYIKSSMIVPFRKREEDNIYGVINLNVVRKEREFTERDTTLVKELISLASIALVPVK